MKKLLSAMLLCGLLVGCGNSVDSIIEDAKDNLQTDVQVEYEKDFEENFVGLMECIDITAMYEVIGYSLENRVIVVSRELPNSDYNDLVEYSFAERDNREMQSSMSRYELNDVTVYVEYYNEDGGRFALVTVTSDDYEIEEVK